VPLRITALRRAFVPIGTWQAGQFVYYYPGNSRIFYRIR
jgi:hypothetical protein